MKVINPKLKSLSVAMSVIMISHQSATKIIVDHFGVYNSMLPVAWSERIGWHKTLKKSISELTTAFCRSYLHKQFQKCTIQHKRSTACKMFPQIMHVLTQNMFCRHQKWCDWFSQGQTIFHISTHLVASFPGHLQLWRNCKIKSGCNLGMKLATHLSNWCCLSVSILCFVS